MKNSDIKTKWIEALRSGNYKQATCTLKRINFKSNPSYCCLGVLKEVAGMPIPMFTKQRYYGENDIVSERNTLSDEERKELDISVGEMKLLMELNDYGKYDFSRIASYIEREM